MDSYSNNHWIQALMDSSVQGVTFSRHIGITLQSLAAEGAVGVLLVEPTHRNPLGIVHGGVHYTLADTVAGYGASAAAPNKTCVTIDGSLNFLRAGTGDKLICTAKPMRIGRSVAVMDTEITDETGSLLAKGMFTFHLSDMRAH